MKKISVIIVTYNSENLIFKSLDSIFKYNDIGQDLEVIIVDNNSINVDCMFSAIESIYGDKVKLIRNSKNGGYGQGNNVGIEVSSSPIIMIMNPDVLLFEPIFKKAICYFKDKNTVMLGMRQMLTKEKQGISFALIDNPFPILSLFLNIICNLLQVYLSKYMYFAGAAFFIRKETFENIGLFDENLFMYFEEYDIHTRLKENNFKKFVYDKSMKYIHLIDDRPFSFKSYEQLIQSGLFFYDKYNLDKNKFIGNKIKVEKFFKLIDTIKGNNKGLRQHEKLLTYLLNLRK